MASPKWNVSKEGHHLPQRLLSFFLPLFLPVFLTQHPPIALCLGLLLRAAKSVMVTALPCPSVGVERSYGPFDTHALASRVLERYSVLHPGSPHLSSGPWWGDNPLSPFLFRWTHTGLLPSTRAAISCAALNDFLLLPKPQSSNLLCIISYWNYSIMLVCYIKGL